VRDLSSVPGLNPLQLHPELFVGRSMPGLQNLILHLGEEVLDDSEQEEVESGEHGNMTS
jgi:hypothetical protein